MRLVLLPAAATAHTVDNACTRYGGVRNYAAKSLMKIMFAGGITLAATAALAEIIATKTINIDQSHDLMITLKDEAGGQCGYLHKTMLTITGGPTFAIPYGDGCWYITKGGLVVIEGRSFSSGQTMQLEHSAESFKTSSYFTQWSDYADQFDDGY
ncbi:hypothetical protein [Azotobacter beijerinckii]|uniref:hypothetical protein n=1 Tax=Azotobacter beijerinckii TaxID=170623 RepID=UPI0029535E01|nr:hypothetical protein [Azotobacter beijerinckii]MDV7210781.1 hypothetical protein [Azotobacter beijerinckii]